MAMLCKDCASILLFNPDSGRLQCKNCGLSYDLEDSKSIADSDLHSLYEAEHHKLTMNYTIHTCGTCGARVSFHGSEINTTCSFCGNSDMRAGGSINKRRPDAIIPFSLSKEKAITRVKAHLAELPYLSAQYRNMKLTNIRGIYIPYYIVNADYKAIIHAGPWKWRLTKSDTAYKPYYRSVSCTFDKLILEASKILPDEASVMVEPYDIKDLKAFHEGYLQGFSSDMADKDSEDIYHQAVQSTRNMIIEECKHSGIVYPKDRIIDADYRPMFTGNAVYALFPIWFVTGETNGKKMTFLVNGQTGKVFGNPPYSQKSFRKNVGLISLITVPVLFALLYFVCRLIAYVVVIPGFFFPHVVYGIFFIGLIISVLLGMIRYRFEIIEKAIKTSTSDTLLNFVKRRSKDVQ